MHNLLQFFLYLSLIQAVLTTLISILLVMCVDGIVLHRVYLSHHTMLLFQPGSSYPWTNSHSNIYIAFILAVFHQCVKASRTQFNTSRAFTPSNQSRSHSYDDSPCIISLRLAQSIQRAKRSKKVCSTFALAAYYICW